MDQAITEARGERQIPPQPFSRLKSFDPRVAIGKSEPIRRIAYHRLRGFDGLSIGVQNQSKSPRQHALIGEADQQLAEMIQPLFAPLQQDRDGLILATHQGRDALAAVLDRPRFTAQGGCLRRL